MKFNINIGMDIEINEHELRALVDIAKDVDNGNAEKRIMCEQRNALTDLRSDIGKLIEFAEKAQQAQAKQQTQQKHKKYVYTDNGEEVLAE